MTEKTGKANVERPVFQSFAEAMSTFAELTKLETSIEIALKEAAVPHHETRKMLRAMNVLDTEATPLFQFMVLLFEKTGLGKLKLARKEIFRMEFTVEGCQVCKLYKNAQGKTCYITAETISKFFTTDLDIPSVCKEMECGNEGGKVCRFLVEMQPLAVYQIALDSTDNEIIEILFKKGESALTCKQIAEETGYAEEEVKFRCEILEKFRIIDSRLKLTEIGIAYRKNRSKVQREEKVFPPPWKNISKITENIAAAESFAEAIARSVEQEAEIVIDEKDIINLAEEAKKSKSFAELLFKRMKDENKEEDKNDRK
ncbi:MAG: 4-vinyl reductase [Thermoplasmata archaeon]|nr:4-vinyl reductase [Thermoplasmata archaeon]